MVKITKKKIGDFIKEYYPINFDTPRKFENEVNRQYQKYLKIKSKPLVKKIDVLMYWTNIRGLGMCPKATARVTYTNGSHAKFDFPHENFGKKKHIALLNTILNRVALQNLYPKRLNPEQPNGYSCIGLFPIYDIDHDHHNFGFFTVEHLTRDDTTDGYLIKFR